MPITGGPRPAIGARVYHSAYQTIPRYTITPLSFDSERWDTDNIHDTVTNNSRLTCRTPGYYLIVAQVVWDNVAVGRRILDIRLNGTTFIGRHETGSQADSLSHPGLTATTVWKLEVGDYVEACVYHGADTSVDIMALADHSPEFMMIKIA